MSTRWRRRGAGVLVVGITATLAWAGGDAANLDVTPRLIGIEQTVGSNLAMTVSVHNAGAGSFLGRIVGNCGAAPAMRVAGGTGDPLAISPNGTTAVQLECPATLPVGMHRCTFDVQSSLGVSVATFDAFCATFSSQPLTASPASVSFDSQQVGVTSSAIALTITNPTATSILPISLQVDDPNFLIGTPCQDQTGCDAGKLLANSTTPVDVRCRPLTAGNHVGKLFLTDAEGIALPAISLTCNASAGSGAPVLTIDPPNVSITPAVEVLGGSASATVTLANGGTGGTLSITSLQINDAAVALAANDWTSTIDGQCQVLPCSLAASQALNVRLGFDPSGFNARPATLVVNYLDPDGSKQASVALDGSGVGATVQLIGAPSLEFGVVPLTTTATRAFKLQNVGNRDTSLMLAASPMAPFGFPVALTVSPGEAMVSVTCTSATEVDASVDLSLAGPDTPSALLVPLHCDVRNTQLTTNPTSLSLGEVRLGDTAPAVTVTVDRVGAGPALGLLGAQLSPTHPSLALDPLAPLATPAMTKLTVTPITEGAIASSILVTPMVGDALPVPVDLAVVRAELVADDVMTLGTFCVGQPVSKTSISLSSKGTATVKVTDVQLSGGDGSPFELERSVPDTYPTSLAPLVGKATVLVTPKRSETPNEDVHDTLVWSTDAGPITSMLTTRFVADGGAVAPEVLDFQDVPIRLVNDDAQGVTLQNCSADPLQLLMPTVPAPFELTGEFPLLLDPGAKATFSILFLPVEVGPIERELAIQAMSGDSFLVKLRGNGVTGDGTGPGDDEPGTVEETSFYACGCRSSGDPSGVLAIALAVLGCVRRRVSR